MMTRRDITPETAIFAVILFPNCSYRNAKSKHVNFVPALRFVVVILVLAPALMSQFPLHKTETQISLLTGTGFFGHTILLILSFKIMHMPPKRC